MPDTVHAQGPYCPGYNCTANDVQQPNYFLGDASGNPLASVVCTPGNPVTGVYLWLTYTVTATNRYEINVVGDVLIDGIYDHSFDVCLGDHTSGTYTELIEPLTWTCGSELTIEETLFAWNNQEQGDNPDVCSTCPDQSSKCARFSTLVVVAPIVANFSYTSTCVPGTTYEVFTFTDETTGGETPYSNYNWDFGSGASPTPSTTSGSSATGPFTVEYSSSGVKTVSLTVTDAVGTTSVYTENITVNDNPTVSVTADDQTICDGGVAVLTANVSGAGSGDTTFQWQYNDVGGAGWTNVGSDQDTYTTPTLTPGTYEYRVIVTRGTGCEGTSTPITVTVLSDPTVSITPSATSYCEGQTALLTANVSGGTGTTTYQWQYNDTGGGGWTNVGTNSSTYTTPVHT
ncbi:MAG: hypothetical protein R3330_01050, partial [Saprospiraceae bacterium]|nr:hypothetical protein [Saprospiraceae bacterium]